MSAYSERRWATPDGLSLYARDYPGGDGEARLPVICLHGLTRNSRDFEDLAPLIAASGRRVIAMDVRGRGQSDRDPRPGNYQPKIYAKDVLGFLEALGIARAIFIGTSMGGLITMTIALLRPRMIAAAVLNDVGPAVDPKGIERIRSYVGKAPEIRSWQEAADYMKSINGAALPDYGPKDWDRMARRTFRDAAGVPQLDYDPAISPNVQSAKVKQSSLIAWIAFRRMGRRVPLLLVRGAQSDILSSDIAGRMKRRVPSLRIAEVPGVGHAPMLDEPEAVKAITSFLADVP